MSRTRYHHGDLRPALLQAAQEALREGGIEALSLRNLAKRADVSPTAIYHHFTDKRALLSALAEQGFRELEARTVAAAEAPARDEHERVLRFVRAYIGFAREQSNAYELMFGRALWSRPTPHLRVVAFATFRRYLEHAVPPGAMSEKALRIAQVSWATLHGLCRQWIDGIYVHEADIDAICEEVATTLVSARSRMT